jgi:hypothetical protein
MIELIIDPRNNVSTSQGEIEYATKDPEMDDFVYCASTEETYTKTNDNDNDYNNDYDLEEDLYKRRNILDKISRELDLKEYEIERKERELDEREAELNKKERELLFGATNEDDEEDSIFNLRNMNLNNDDEEDEERNLYFREKVEEDEEEYKQTINETYMKLLPKRKVYNKGQIYMRLLPKRNLKIDLY